MAILLGAYHSAYQASQGEQGRCSDQRDRRRPGRRGIEIGDGAGDPANTTIRELDDKTGIGARGMDPQERDGMPIEGMGWINNGDLTTTLFSWWGILQRFRVLIKNN